MKCKKNVFPADCVPNLVSAPLLPAHHFCSKIHFYSISYLSTPDITHSFRYCAIFFSFDALTKSWCLSWWWPFPAPAWFQPIWVKLQQKTHHQFNRRQRIQTPITLNLWPNHIISFSVLSFRWGCIISSLRSTSTTFHTLSEAASCTPSGIVWVPRPPIPQTNDDDDDDGDHGNEIQIQVKSTPAQINPNYSRRQYIHQFNRRQRAALLYWLHTSQTEKDLTEVTSQEIWR